MLWEIESERKAYRRDRGDHTDFCLCRDSVLLENPIPAGKHDMARSLNASEISKIEMVVMPSAEDERYRSFGEEEFEDVVRLINKSAGRYTEDPDPLAGMSRTLYITMKDGTEHVVSYNGYLVIDGDSYADHFHGYSEDGESLGKGKDLIPDGFGEYEY